MKSCPKCDKELGDYETMCRCGHKFPDVIIATTCRVCGTEENLTRLNAHELVCADCRWEHYSGEAKNLLKKGYEKAIEQLPKKQGESHYDYFVRYKNHMGKQTFARLPYNPQEDIADNNIDEEAKERLAQNTRVINDEDIARAEARLQEERQ